MIRFLRACLFAAAFMAALILNIQISDAAGALAIGNCGAYGYSHDYAQANAAEAAALGKCNGDCKAVSFRKACAALAVDGQNMCGAHGYAVANRLGAAQNTALQHCYKHGGKDCMIRAWSCDVKG